MAGTTMFILWCVVVMCMVCGESHATTTAHPRKEKNRDMKNKDMKNFEMVGDDMEDVKILDAVPKPEALVLLKDCPLYVLGELSEVKKHGETWFNDESACEFCKCYDGQKRCYYHYCNERITEGYMTPPSGRPPLDDEDRDDGMEEGSGHHQNNDQFYNKVITHIDSWGVHSSSDNEAQSTPMCTAHCDKSCPWGYKLDKDRDCLRCKCHKCPSMAKCQEAKRCLSGLAKDPRGCHICQCQDLYKTPIHHNTHHTPQQQQHHTPTHHTTQQQHHNTVHHTTPQQHNTHHNHHYGHKESCNDTGGSWYDADNLHSGTGISHDISVSSSVSSHNQRSSNDGTTKSAVHASPVDWWQVWVIATPLVLLVVLVCGMIWRYYRRYHHDKYRINAYRPTETEKLRPVTTADDQYHNHNHNHYNHNPYL